MAKHSFFFCQSCQHMYLTAEVVTIKSPDNGSNREVHCCPGCRRNLDGASVEYYDLDPFMPLSWSFSDGVTVDENSRSPTGSELFAPRYSSPNVAFVFMSIGIILAHLGFVIVIQGGFWKLLIIGLIISVIGLIGVILCFRTTRVGVDSDTLYVRHSVYDRNIIAIPRYQLKIEMRIMANSKTGGADSYNVFICYNHFKERMLFSTTRNKNDALRDMRWLTTFARYAYNANIFGQNGKKQIVRRDEMLSSIAAQYESDSIEINTTPSARRQPIVSATVAQAITSKPSSAQSAKLRAQRNQTEQKRIEQEK